MIARQSSLAMWGHSDGGDAIDLVSPANPLHDLNRGRVLWLMDVPGLDEGPKWYDLSRVGGGGLDGSLTGLSAGYGHLPPQRSGGWGRVGFDGANVIANVPHSPTIALTGDMTIGFWMAPTSASLAAVTILCEKGHDAAINCSYGIGWNAGGPLAFVHGNSFFAISSYTPAAGVPIYVTAARSTIGLSVTWYVNGVQQGAPAGYATGPSANTESLGIGGRGNLTAGARYAGWLDDFSLWNRALNAAQALDAYRATVARHPGVLNRWTPPLASSAPSSAPKGALIYHRRKRAG